MNKIKSRTILKGMFIFIMLFIEINAINGQSLNQEIDPAEDTLSTVSPHGGIMNRSGEYIIEMVTKENVISYYLYDNEIKPISNKEVKGIAVFKFPNKSTVSVKLLPEGLNGYHTGKKNLSNYVSCKTTFWIQKKSVTADFIKPVMSAIKYTCSIHPEIVMDKPGKCPRCGMDLVEKKEMAKKLTPTNSY